MASPASGWISFWEQNLLDDHQQTDFPWSDLCLEDVAQRVNSHDFQCSSLTCSTENENSKEDFSNQNKKKRPRDDGLSGPQGKACREKMRRDRMNDRFVELSAVLEPEKPPKTDKASILRDATKIISQLRAESQHYKEANKQLQEMIKELKAEKNELREEKLNLKTEKENLEKRLNAVQVIPGCTGQLVPPSQAADVLPLANHALYAKSAGASSAYGHHQNKHVLTKHPMFSDMHFTTTMSQWIPPEVADVSKDHVLRPPVA